MTNCIASFDNGLACYFCNYSRYLPNKPFADHRSGVGLDAADFADLNPRGGAGGAGVPLAGGQVEIYGDVVKAGPPGRGLPVEHSAGLLAAQPPLFQSCCHRARFPSLANRRGRRKEEGEKQHTGNRVIPGAQGSVINRCRLGK